MPRLEEFECSLSELMDELGEVVEIEEDKGGKIVTAKETALCDLTMQRTAEHAANHVCGSVRLLAKDWTHERCLAIRELTIRGQKYQRADVGEKDGGLRKVAVMSLDRPYETSESI